MTQLGGRGEPYGSDGREKNKQVTQKQTSVFLVKEFFDSLISQFQWALWKKMWGKGRPCV